MHRRWLPWAVCGACAFALSAEGGLAQEREALLYDTTSAHTRVTQQYRVPVDDAPDHYLRVYELQRRFTFRPPVFRGVRAAELWERGQSDVVDQNGSESAYVTYVLEDGARVFGRYAGVIQSFRWPDGSRHVESHGVITLTGGTGSFASIHGVIRVRWSEDPGADSSQGEAKGEYWFGK